MEHQKKITVTVWIWQDHSGLAASHNSSCLWAGSGQDQLWGRTSCGTGSALGQDLLWGRISCGAGLALGQDQLWGRISSQGRISSWGKIRSRVLLLSSKWSLPLPVCAVGTVDSVPSVL